MNIRTKKIYFFTVFLIDTYSMTNFITKIDLDRKFQSWAFIWYQNCVAVIAICVKILLGNL